MPNNRRVLITGSNGYIGSVMAPWLQSQGYDVVGLDTGYFSACTLVPDHAEVPTIGTDLREVTARDLAGFDQAVSLDALGHGLVECARCQRQRLIAVTNTHRRPAPLHVGAPRSVSPDHANPVIPDGFEGTYGNYSPSTAASITQFINPYVSQIALSNLRINSAGQEWFSVTVPASTTGTMTVAAQSGNLSSLSPSVAVLNASQQFVGAASAPGSYGWGGFASVSIPRSRVNTPAYTTRDLRPAAAATWPWPASPPRWPGPRWAPSWCCSRCWPRSFCPGRRPAP